jgi:chaperonin cofactor prefoldin
LKKKLLRDIANKKSKQKKQEKVTKISMRIFQTQTEVEREGFNSSLSEMKKIYDDHEVYDLLGGLRIKFMKNVLPTKLLDTMWETTETLWKTCRPHSTKRHENSGLFFISEF